MTRALSSIPVLGFETSDHHAVPGGQDYSVRNVGRVVSYIPILSLFTGPSWIKAGIHIINHRNDHHPIQYRLHDKVTYPILKGSGFIVRGVISTVGAGFLFFVPDLLSTIGRSLFR